MKNLFAIAAAVGMIEPTTRAVLLGNEDALLNSLRDLLKAENDIEQRKLNLAMKPDFNLHDAFSIFAVNGEKRFNKNGLKSRLNHIGLYPTPHELDLWIAEYDTNGDRKITLKEFDDAFLSTNAYYADMVNKRGSN